VRLTAASILLDAIWVVRTVSKITRLCLAIPSGCLDQRWSGSVMSVRGEGHSESV